MMTETEYLEALNSATNGGLYKDLWNYHLTAYPINDRIGYNKHTGETHGHNDQSN